jgi:hypothetical protein
MRERHPLEVRKAVVLDFLKNVGRNESATNVSATVGRVSPASVSNIRNEFRRKTKKKGIETAAGEYGLEDVIAQTQQILSHAEENGLRLEEVLEGANLAAELRKSGISADEAARYVPPVFARLRDKGMTPERAVEQVAELNRLEKASGKPYQEIVSDFSSLKGKVEAARKKRDELSKEVLTLEREIGALFADDRTTKLEVERHVADRNTLASVGLGLDDAAAAARGISNMKQMKYDPKKWVAKLKEADDLEEKVAGLKRELSSAAISLEALKSDVKAARDELAAREADLVEVGRLRELGFELGTLASIRRKVVTASERRGIDIGHALEIFKSEILQGYDAALGLRAELEDYEKKIDEMERRSEGLEAAYDARKKAVDAYVSLGDRGISDEILVSWDGMLTATGLDAREVTQELKKIESLSHTIQERQEALDETERALAARKTEVGVQDAISEAQKQALAELQPTIEGAKTAISELSRALDAGLELGGYRPLVVLKNLHDGKDEDRKDLLPVMASLIKDFGEWLARSSMEDKGDLKEAAEKFEEELGYGIQPADW